MSSSPSHSRKRGIAPRSGGKVFPGARPRQSIGDTLVVSQVGRPRRYRNIPKDSIHSITKPDIRRLARRGGVKRISGGIYGETRHILRNFLREVHVCQNPANNRYCRTVV
jgi:hypothetical protein